MFFLNLSLGEFLGLLGLVSGLVTALYLLDRAKRKKVVSTLRFWRPAVTADERQSRKRMREPWSLLLQLLGMMLLLLAIAQLQWGKQGLSGRDHVLLLDISAWSAARSPGGTVLDLEKRAAQRYVRTIGGNDRLLVVRADGLAAPATPFTSATDQLTKAIAASTSRYSALNLEQALSFAQQAQSWSGGRPGDIVYIGPRRIAEPDPTLPRIPNLRLLTVAAPLGNRGIRRISVKRNEDDPNTWQATVLVKNYSNTPQVVRLNTQFAGTVFAPRVVSLAPNEEKSVEYAFVTNVAGQLIAQIEGQDSLASDDRAVLRLPRSGRLTVAVYTARPDVLKPLLDANHRLNVSFYDPGQYVPKPAADIMLLDQMAPPAPPQIANFWIDPPRARSPLPVRELVTDTSIKAWHSESALGAGLHATETPIPQAEVFQTFDGDIAVATVAEGPVVEVRPSAEGRPKTAVIGFDPLHGQMRFEVTTPLLFANLLRWLSPESFRTLEISAAPVGTATAALDPSERPEHVRVADERGFSIPFTIRDQTVQLFASRPSLVRITSDDRERYLSLTLPDVAEFEWKAPPTAREGVPTLMGFTPPAIDLWQWLAVAGGLVLFIEWMIFGRRRIVIRRKSTIGAPSAQIHERELVSK
ncbi:MAG TPA: VWA domain-containing protein [Bryobacteraceae bacterium]|nr:VWA domain-containing protein [Bryobacteraceae bacterium]